MRIISENECSEISGSGSIEMFNDVARQAGKDLAGFLNDAESVISDIQKAWTVRFM